LDKIIKSKNKKEKEALEKQMDALVYSDNVEMYEYDPIAIMPFDIVPPELQEERIRKYGTEGVPASFIKQHPDWVAKPITDSGQRQPIQAIQKYGLELSLLILIERYLSLLHLLSISTPTQFQQQECSLTKRHLQNLLMDQHMI